MVVMEGVLRLARVPVPLHLVHHLALTLCQRTFPHNLFNLRLPKRSPVVLVSVKKSTKGKGQIKYDVITQVVVNLSSATCSVNGVSQLVAKQVDFDVILLDSKGFPLLNNESTSGESFWKSTRKILVRSYIERWQAKIWTLNGLTKDDDSCDDSVTPVKRKCVCSDLAVANKIDAISQQVSTLASSITFMQNMQRSFECVVCKGPPMIAKCCGRVVGLREQMAGESCHLSSLLISCTRHLPSQGL